MSHGYHMSAEDFRRHGREVIDWIARYMEESEKYPVLSQVKPGAVQDKLPDHPPEQGAPFDSLLGDLEQIVMPGITHWQSPNFFAYFPANISGPSILGDLLSSGLGVQGMLWATSPACTEVETVMLNWTVDALGLPSHFKSASAGGGCIQDSASSSTLCALVAARERHTQLASNREGVTPGLKLYASEHAHSSIVKAARIAGLGDEALRMVPTDAHYAMKPDALAAMVEEDRAQGAQPFFVMATVGSTSSNAIDPLEPIGELCVNHGLWMHVDAAMSGSAAVCPEFRWIHKGVENADSYTFNPHKWLFVNFDCNCFFVKDREALTSALRIMPAYLDNDATGSGGVFDYRDWQIPLGRRFRALKLWFVLRHYGLEGLRHHIREHVALTQQFAQWVDDDPDFERVARAPLNLVCFRHCSNDATNREIMNTVNASGEMYVTHTELAGRFILRMAIGHARTQEHHVARAWEQLRKTAQELVATRKAP